MNTYRVKRYIIEYFQVEAETRKEALENAENPYQIKVIRETCVKEKKP